MISFTAHFIFLAYGISYLSFYFVSTIKKTAPHAGMETLMPPDVNADKAFKVA